MLHYFKTDSLIKPLIVAGLSALILAGCGEEKTTTTTTGAVTSEYELPNDHAIGNPEAIVTVVEYASVVCGACANFHNTVYADFKEKYIDSGKVRFIFREFPTSPENLAKAGFLIANCADESKFFENISLQFKRQRAILTSSDVRQEYVNIAKAAGLSEEEFNACMIDEAENQRYEDVVKGGIDAGVNSTPTFFINGKNIKRTPSGKQLFTLESFDEVLGPLLGEAVQDTPSETPSENTVPSEPTEQ